MNGDNADIKNDVLNGIAKDGHQCPKDIDYCPDDDEEEEEEDCLPHRWRLQ